LTPFGFVRAFGAAADANSRALGTHTHTVNTKTPARTRRGPLQTWDAATRSRALYVANWEGDAILEYGVGLDDSVAFRRVFASDPRLRHPEGMVFVHRFDAAGNLVRAERCADEAPNYLLCV